MSNILSQQDPYCIINNQGYFIFVNEQFLSLFSVTEQECYNQLKLQDLIVSSEIVSIFQPSYEEIVFKNKQGEYFAALMASSLIKETSMYAVSIRILAQEIVQKRIVTSFRRYIDNQLAVICLKYNDDNNFLPLINFNTDIIDDNPSFLINIGVELTNFLNNNVRNIKNFSGVIKPQKLENYQNYYSIPYVFQLLVPNSDNDSQLVTEIITETFLIAFIFPTPLLELFKDEERFKKIIQEHLSQLNSPSELSIQLLDEIKQKVVLYFDSQSMASLSYLEQKKHNLDVYTKNLHNLEYMEAIKLFTEFCIKNFDIMGIALYQNSLNGFEQLFVINSINIRGKNFPPTIHLKQEVLGKPIIIENTYFLPYYNKSKEIIGLVGICPSENSRKSINEILIFITKKLTTLNELLVQTNIEHLRKMIEAMKFENNIFGLYEIVKEFVLKVFQNEVRLFAAFQYDSKSEILNFVSQSGYSSTFNVKSIALNSNNSVVARAGRERTILNISDVSKCSFYLEGDPSIKSELTIPLVYNNQLIGVLNIESQKFNAFSKTYHQPLFQLICDLVMTNYIRISAVKKIEKINLL